MEERKLVSGGAAWADHLAVSLFLANKATRLQLHLPAYWCKDAEAYIGHAGPVPGYADTGVVDWKTNPGGTANYYHKKFSAAMNGDTLAGIQRAIDKGATYRDDYSLMRGSAFHNRNHAVGRVDRLVAFTWAPLRPGASLSDPQWRTRLNDSDNRPADGGTSHTWSHSDAPEKIHVPLRLLLPAS